MIENEYLTEMKRAFGLPDIRNICFDLNVDFEDLAQGGKSTKINALFQYMKEDRRLGQLTAALNEQRPRSNFQVPTENKKIYDD